MRIKCMWKFYQLIYYWTNMKIYIFQTHKCIGCDDVEFTEKYTHAYMNPGRASTTIDIENIHGADKLKGTKGVN